MTSDETDARLNHLVAPAQQAAAPQLTETALERRFGPRSTWVPAPGQIWRAMRDDIGVLVLLLAIEADSVTAVPVTIESIAEAADTLLIEEQSSSFGVEVTVWLGLRRDLSIGVLDRPVDDMAGPVVRRLADRAVRPEEAPRATGAGWSDPAVSEARAVLEDDLAALVEAPEMNAAEAEGHVTDAIDIDALTPEALDEVASRLGTSLPVVLDLIDGKRAPTPEQTAIMHQVLGAAPVAAPPPRGLLTEFSQPRWRGLVRHRRRRDDLTDAAARLALAYEVDAMAARQTGGQEPSWPDRIRRWAQGNQLDPDIAE